MRRWMGIVGAAWGLVGIVGLLVSAIWRLTPYALEMLEASGDFSWYHWAALGANLLFMAYSEGYRGFQQGFSPRVAARAKYLRDRPNVLRTVLAPLFCMGFFHATRRRKIVSISLTAGIVTLIVLVRLLPQPWRGIVDAGVVVGLAWGVMWLVIYAFQAFAGSGFDHPPEVPAEATVAVAGAEGG